MKSGKLITGLVVFFILLLFSHNKPVYFLSYIISGSVFLWSGYTARESVFYLLLMSMIFDVGVGGRWFLLQPEYLNLGSGWWLSPFTILVFLLLFLTLSENKANRISKFKLKTADIFILIFFLWNSLSFFYRPNFNSILGFMQLFETIVFYFLSRIYIDREQLKFSVIILLSLVLFQVLIS